MNNLRIEFDKACDELFVVVVGIEPRHGSFSMTSDEMGTSDLRYFIDEVVDLFYDFQKVALGK
jgi:hypothetical protein